MVVEYTGHQVTMFPSLLFNCPEGDTDLIYLGNYEILACEPLHNIENHIKNLFEELPHHMAEKKFFTNKNHIEQMRIYFICTAKHFYI